jgi:hypothetical protein
MNEYEFKRRQTTRFAHTVIEQDHCVFCGSRRIKSRLFASGHTLNLDHFIPAEIVTFARQGGAEIPNFLLPCCPLCNNCCGQYFFASFVEKFAYVQSRRNVKRRLDDNSQCDKLTGVAAPKELLGMIFPIQELPARGGYVIIWPYRLETGSWDISQRAEKVLQWRPTTPCSVSSAMAF